MGYEMWNSFRLYPYEDFVHCFIISISKFRHFVYTFNVCTELSGAPNAFTTKENVIPQTRVMELPDKYGKCSTDADVD